LGFVIGSFLIFPPSSLFIAAVLWGGRMVVTAPVVFIVLHRLIHTSTLEFFKVTWAPVVGTGIMAAVLLSLQSRILSDFTPLQMLMLEIPLGAFVYATVIALVKPESLQRLYLFIASGIRGGATSQGEVRANATKIL
jgi:hypothetical protein